MRQAIVTKYFGPRNTRGSRIKAYADAGYCYVEYDGSLSSELNHMAAAKKLADKFGWLEDKRKLEEMAYLDRPRLYGGGIPGNKYAFVIIDELYLPPLPTVKPL